MRVQLGAIWMPAPTSPNSAERSSTRTLQALAGQRERGGQAADAAADHDDVGVPLPELIARFLDGLAAVPAALGAAHARASLVAFRLRAVRLSFSASKTGESLKRNRSSAPESESEVPASDLAENGCQDGTTNRSPRPTDQVLSPTVTVPEPSKTV